MAWQGEQDERKGEQEGEGVGEWLREWGDESLRGGMGELWRGGGVEPQPADSQCLA